MLITSSMTAAVLGLAGPAQATNGFYDQAF